MKKDFVWPTAKPQDNSKQDHKPKSKSAYAESTYPKKDNFEKGDTKKDKNYKSFSKDSPYAKSDKSAYDLSKKVGAKFSDFPFPRDDADQSNDAEQSNDQVNDDDSNLNPEEPQYYGDSHLSTDSFKLKIGRINNLEIVKEVDFGLYLDGGDEGEILLPIRYVPEKYNLGDKIDVFIYFDSEDRLIATTEKPLAMVGHFAFLKVVDTNRVGAFLDWGLPKNILVPFSEQKPRMLVGQSYLVKIYIDTYSGRILASTKLDKFMGLVPKTWKPGRKVNLIIHSITHLGYKTVVDKTCWGLLYKNEVFEPLKVGQETQAYINRIRDNEKLDLSLEKTGYQKIDPISAKILAIIKASGGALEINDSSSPQSIYDAFHISKKTFKKALGALYKRRLILITRKGLKLNK